MAAKKATPKGSPSVTADQVAAGGEPVGRWAEVLAEGQKTPGLAIAPFEVTADLVLQPMTPTRARKFAAAQRAYFAGLTASANAAQYGAAPEEVANVEKAIEEAINAFNEALFGEDEYPRVEQYFAARPAWQKDLFIEAVKKQFLRLPDDGRCQLCGHVDEETAEKADGSSTTSSITGPSSKQTSQSNSTELTSETGAEGSDPGPSS